MKERNTLGLFLSILLILTIFFSALFVSMEMAHHHDCSEENCPICSTIEACLNNIRVCGTATAVLISVFLFIPFIIIIKKIREAFHKYSLIQKRVRLNY